MSAPSASASELVSCSGALFATHGGLSFASQHVACTVSTSARRSGHGVAYVRHVCMPCPDGPEASRGPSKQMSWSPTRGTSVLSVSWCVRGMACDGMLPRSRSIAPAWPRSLLTCL
ncbi:hypothetical protein DAEQUDRAFT_581135 [Daedalea quercina L-15889]|uniref:Uncharacterized protein n=1 Tax=Daedalea quercina L-15889 TaxID=1314783 RepID=A0A165LRB9_9APHY|nr:hypothetical protein DAEQUDRAFT_581135 [Daedalea quercina L-15889]